MLGVFGNVEVEFRGIRGRLVADGQRFVLDVDRPSALIGVVDLGSARTLAAGLAGAGLTLDVRSGNRLLFLAGRDAETGILSRVLHLPGVRLSPRSTVRTALGRGRLQP